MANSFRGGGLGVGNSYRQEPPSGGFNNLRSGQPGDALGDNTVRGPLPGLIGANIGDVVDGLPPPAATRLQGMRERAADLGVLARNSFEIEQELQTEKAQIENRIRVLKQARGDGGHSLRDDDPRVRAEQKSFDLKTAELARRRELAEVRGHELTVLMRINASCEMWAQGGGRPGGTQIVAFDGELPSMKPGTDILADIESLRRHLRELDAERHRVEGAQYPKAGLMAKSVAEVEAEAEIGRPSLHQMLEHGGSGIIWPTTQVQVKIFNGTEPLIGFVEMFDAKAVFCWMHKAALLKALEADADASSDGSALTDAQRQKQLAVIAADILATERAEAQLCWTAQERGMAISHREDCDPRALLGLDLIVASSGPLSDDRSHLTEYLGVPR